MVQAQYHACSRHGYAPLYCGFQPVGILTTACMRVSAHQLRPWCSRTPETWRFECECPPTLETEYAPYGNQTASTGLSSPMQVTPNLVNPSADH